jgi:FAD/FMN-containing dehydrogenase
MVDTALQKIVGLDNVLTQPDILAGYADSSSPTSLKTPGCVVRPKNATEVEAIVKWANENRNPLVPVSSGPLHGRGDTTLANDGSVIVDLSRINRIIRIDSRNKIAMIEPGVTFGELQEALAKEGLCAYMPLLPRRNKSVTGSVLEREPITRPGHHWDSTDPLLCAEVVFGNGDRFRTGEASGPDTIEEQWEMDRVQMNPFGHSHVDFQRLLSGAQGTMGIVTWITVKCNYLSEVSRAYLVPSPKIEPLIDLCYQLAKFRFGGNIFIVNGLNLACLLGSNHKEIQEIKKDLPAWIMLTSFEGYGILPEDKVASEEADFKALAAEYKLKPVTAISGARAETLSGLLSLPSPEPYWTTRYKGSSQDIFFLTTLNKTPDFSLEIHKMVESYNYPSQDIGVYIQPIVQGTSCHCEFNLYHDPTEFDTANKLIAAGSEKVAAMGGFFSRPYPAWKDIAYRQAAGTAGMQRKVKNLFDPNGILNPGKLCF